MSGAIHKTTGIYTLAENAHKEDNYICLCHNEPLIVRKGIIKQPHYAHYPHSKSTTERLHYAQGESIQHIDAKYILYNHIQRKQPLTIVKRCFCCEEEEDIFIPTQDSIEVCIEKRMSNGTRIDVWMKTETTEYCFEVRYTSPSNSRPEPFYEIHTDNIFRNINRLPDIRAYKCAKCKEDDRIKALKYEENYKEAVRIAQLRHQKVLQETLQFNCGKYKGERVSDIIKKNPTYCVWILQQEAKTMHFRSIQAYLRTRLKNPDILVKI